MTSRSPRVSTSSSQPIRSGCPKGTVAATTTIYLNAKAGVAACLQRGLEAGAKIVQPVTSIAPHGTIALIEDLDSNIVGLHANPESQP